MEEYYNRKIQNNIKRQKTKNICIKILTIILLAMIIINFIVLLQMKIAPNETPNLFGLKAFCIISGSMKPEINVNDVIIVKKVQQEELHINDIISFKMNEEIITHRIINVQKENDEKVYYVTKGDANNTEDTEKITFENIEGKYIFKIEKIGYLITAIQNKITLIVVMTMLAILYVIEQRNTKKKEKRSKEREEYENEKNNCNY